MNEMPIKTVPALNANDFASDQEVRWCPGCGDYAILKAVKSVLADIGRSPGEVVFVAGIGCAARFPYYLSTYGFHTIHGRAAAVATGVKLANPDVDVWVVVMAISCPLAAITRCMRCAATSISTCFFSITLFMD